MVHGFVNSNSKWYDGWIQKGNLHMSKHEYQNAIDCFDMVLEIMPSNSDAVAGKSSALKQLETQSNNS